MSGSSGDGGGSKWRRGKFSLFVLIFQVIFVVLFAIFVEYAPSAQPKGGDDDSHSRKRRADGDVFSNDNMTDHGDDETTFTELTQFYPSKNYGAL